ncbi:MAG: PaaI family thioesterase [Deltaproteobacteria bacterium]|nr:PaaI family thioesterase [Candidatus Tharpella sp.]
MNQEWTQLPNHDKGCFACGTQNNCGLKMRFSSNGKQLRSILTVPGYARGWNKLVHGGILATILDEIMSWTTLHLTSYLILTRNINVEFKKPVYIDEQLTVMSEIVTRDGKKALLKAWITDESGDICCLSKGNFVLFTKEEFDQLDIV